MKATVTGIIAMLSGLATLFLGGYIGFLVIGDIAAGALRGKPETGWGFLIAMFMSPFLAASLIIFLKSYKAYGHAIYGSSVVPKTGESVMQPPVQPSAVNDETQQQNLASSDHELGPPTM